MSTLSLWVHIVGGRRLQTEYNDSKVLWLHGGPFTASESSTIRPSVVELYFRFTTSSWRAPPKLALGVSAFADSRGAKTNQAWWKERSSQCSSRVHIILIAGEMWWYSCGEYFNLTHTCSVEIGWRLALITSMQAPLNQPTATSHF